MGRALNAVNVSGAGAISLLVLATMWESWRALALAVGLQLAVLVFNAWVNLVDVPRRGRRAEVLRTVVNLGVAVVVNQLAGWPLPVWLWLPFVALAFDHLDRRVATGVLAATCVVQDSLALLHGVHWSLPLSSTVLAAYASEVSRLRHGAVRDMLARSDRDRLELARAHEAARLANETLVAEMTGRQAAERELNQTRNLRLVGALAAGVAHEINTPVQFVANSLVFIQDAMHDVDSLLERQHSVVEAASKGLAAEAEAETALRAETAMDLAYLRRQIPEAVRLALEGLDRVAAIARSTRELAHPGASELGTIDLNRAIANTLIVARAEYTCVADVRTDYGDLPPVRCQAGEINQAVLNLIVNAAHAIGDSVKGTTRRGLISITTRCVSGTAVIQIADDGTGIPEAIRDRIFEPFFTTKGLGQGSGQGLAIARTVIVDRHGGDIAVETAAGQGTTFTLRLPVVGRSSASTAAGASTQGGLGV